MGLVDSVKRGALVREVPSAEEPAESPSKKPMCERSQRPKECMYRNQSNNRERLASDGVEGSATPV